MLCISSGFPSKSLWHTWHTKRLLDPLLEVPELVTTPITIGDIIHNAKMIAIIIQKHKKALIFLFNCLFFGSNGSLMEVEFMDPILIFFQAFIDFPLNCFGVGFCLYLIITT